MADMDFKEKLRSLNFGKRTTPKEFIDRDRGTRTTEVLHNDTGEIAAHSIEHSDGRVDANVFAKAAKMSTEGGT